MWCLVLQMYTTCTALVCYVAVPREKRLMAGFDRSTREKLREESFGEVLSDRIRTGLLYDNVKS